MRTKSIAERPSRAILDALSSAHALLEHVAALRGELLDVTDKLAEIDWYALPDSASGVLTDR